jgi:hypothetical protein
MRSRASVVSLPAQRSLGGMWGSVFDLAGLTITAAQSDAFEALTSGCSSNFAVYCILAGHRGDPPGESYAITATLRVGHAPDCVDVGACRRCARQGGKLHLVSDHRQVTRGAERI